MIGMEIMTLLLVVCAVFAWFKNEIKFYTTPLFLLTAVGIAVLIIISLSYIRLRIKKIGFFVSHIGLVLVILSGFLSFIYRNTTHFNIPVDETRKFSEVINDEGDIIQFGFNIAVEGFTVEKYPSEYQLLVRDGESSTGLSVVEDRIDKNKEGKYLLGHDLAFERFEHLFEGNTSPLMELERGYFLKRLPEVDKNYEVTFVIEDVKQRVDTTIKMNHPYSYKGWKFYIMDYDHDHGNYVTLLAKNDPATIPLGIAIWMIMIGTSIMCFNVWEKGGEKQ